MMKKLVRFATIGLLLSSLVIPAAWADAGNGQQGQEGQYVPGSEGIHPAPISDNASSPVQADPKGPEFDWQAALEEDGVTVHVEPVTSSITQVLLQMGPRPSTGYSIAVTRIEFVDETAYIYYQIKQPVEGSFNATVITEPFTATYVDADYDIVVLAEPPAMIEPYLPDSMLPEPDHVLPEPSGDWEEPEPIISYFDGTITNISYPDDQSFGGWLARVELTMNDEEPYDRVILFVNDDTEIIKMEDGEPVPATYEQLENGLQIEAEASGPAMMSYPMQVGADKITIK